MDASLKKVVSKIPLCQTRAGPRDGDAWLQRLAEEYAALIKVCLCVGRCGHDDTALVVRAHLDHGRDFLFRSCEAEGLGRVVADARV